MRASKYRFGIIVYILYTQELKYYPLVQGNAENPNPTWEKDFI